MRDVFSDALASVSQPLRHKHRDTPARRNHCDTKHQTCLGVSREFVTITTRGPKAPACPDRCVTNTGTRQRVATLATQWTTPHLGAPRQNVTMTKEPECEILWPLVKRPTQPGADSPTSA